MVFHAAPDFETYVLPVVEWDYYGYADSSMTLFVEDHRVTLLRNRIDLEDFRRLGVEFHFDRRPSDSGNRPWTSPTELPGEPIVFTDRPKDGGEWPRVMTPRLIPVDWSQPEDGSSSVERARGSFGPTFRTQMVLRRECSHDREQNECGNLCTLCFERHD